MAIRHYFLRYADRYTVSKNKFDQRKLNEHNR